MKWFLKFNDPICKGHEYSNPQYIYESINGHYGSKNDFTIEVLED